MSWWLRACIVLVDGSSSVPSTHIMHITPAYTQLQGIWHLPPHTQTNTHTHGKKKKNKTAIPHTGVGLFSDACTCKRARSTLVHQAALAWKHTFGLSLVLYQGEQTHVYISWRKTTMIILNRISELAVSFLWASPQFAKAVFSLLFLPLQVWSHTSNSSRGALLWV